MGLLSEVYVNPALNANSGSGTIGDPYGDLEHALATHARDTTNGNRINIKAGVDEVLSAPLSHAVFGSPSATAPLIFQGYTAVAGDGGYGGISGGGSVAIFAAPGTGASIQFRHLNLHNTGSATIIAFAQVTQCKVHNTSGIGINAIGFAARYCEITDCATGVSVSAGGIVDGCYFKNGSIRNFTQAISSGGSVRRCIFSLSGGSNGISQGGTAGRVEHCSFFCAGGTGAGVVSAGGVVPVILNSLFEGFSGAGGRGINYFTADLGVYGGNAFFNNATNTAFDIDHIDLGSNETLASSPFAKVGADTFANRFAYFAPKNVGNVRGGAYGGGGNLSKGAIQGASGGGVSRSRLVNVGG